MKLEGSSSLSTTEKRSIKKSCNPLSERTQERKEEKEALNFFRSLSGEGAGLIQGGFGNLGPRQKRIKKETSPAISRQQVWGRGKGACNSRPKEKQVH